MLSAGNYFHGRFTLVYVKELRGWLVKCVYQFVLFHIMKIDASKSAISEILKRNDDA